MTRFDFSRPIRVVYHTCRPANYIAETTQMLNPKDTRKRVISLFDMVTDFDPSTTNTERIRVTLCQNNNIKHLYFKI